MHSLLSHAGLCTSTCSFNDRLCKHAATAVPIQVRDDTEFDDGGGADTAGDGDGGDATSAAAGSGLPWDDDPSRDYKYEELLGGQLVSHLA